MQHLGAGPFSLWLHKLRDSLAGEDGVSVPCGEHTACCRSSLFIHIGPEESQTLAEIPKELPFPAPGFPEGYVLWGYDRKGRCPMFIEDHCSIYEHRPLTCRELDCGVLAAAGLADESDNTPIVQQAQRWNLAFPAQDDHDGHSAMRATVTFLRDHADLFPRDSSRET